MIADGDVPKEGECPAAGGVPLAERVALHLRPHLGPARSVQPWDRRGLQLHGVRRAQLPRPIARRHLAHTTRTVAAAFYQLGIALECESAALALG